MPKQDTYKAIRKVLADLAPKLQFQVYFGSPKNSNYRNSERTVEISYNADLLAERGIKQAQLRAAVKAVLDAGTPDYPNLTRISFAPYQTPPVSPTKLAALTNNLQAVIDQQNLDPAAVRAVVEALAEESDTRTKELYKQTLAAVAPQAGRSKPKAAVELNSGLSDAELAAEEAEDDEERAPLCPICGDRTDDGAHPDEGYCERTGVHYDPETGEPLDADDEA